MTSGEYPASWLSHPEWIEEDQRNSHAFGIHAYLSWLGCLRRAHLEGDADSGDDATFGTNVHSWWHSYHTGAPLPLLSDTYPERSCSEHALVSRYAQRFSRQSLGRVLLSEVRLRGVLRINGRDYPIAGGLDKVTEHDDYSASLFAAEHNGCVIESGIYLNDAKTKKSNTEMTIPMLMHGDQATLYMELLRQNFPEWAAKLRGTLFHIMYRYIKDREDNSQFQTVNVGMPSEEAMTRLKGIIVDAWERLERYGKDHVMPSRCFDYGRQCPVFYDCSRSNLTLAA